MTPSTPSPPSARRRRDALAVVGAAAVLLLAANTVSVAAGGPSLMLGQPNQVKGSTVLANTGFGPALRLKSKATAPSLAVSSSKLVRHLNADLLDGQSLGTISPPTYAKVMPLVPGTTYEPVNTQYFTTKLPAGRYLVSLSGSAAGSSALSCSVYDAAYNDSTNVPTTRSYILTRTIEGNNQVADLAGSEYATIPAGHRIHYYCFATGPVTIVSTPIVSFRKAPSFSKVPGEARVPPPMFRGSARSNRTTTRHP